MLSQEERPTVSVIIPARNEEENLPNLLKSLQQQTLKPDEILVMDDGSQDRTTGVALSFDVKVFQLNDKPPGWNGKSWACWTGAKHAKSEVLVYLDADTTLERTGLEGLLSAWMQKKGALSVQPYHETRKPYEKLSAFLNIMVMAGMNAFTAFGEKLKPAGAFGPCIVIGREDYFRSGGHEAVKGALLEDIPLGKNFMEKGLHLDCRSGRGCVSFRMYPNGLKSQVEGWSKSFALGASDTKPLVMFGTILWISGCFTALTGALPFRGDSLWVFSSWGLAVYLLYALQVYVLSRNIGSFGIRTALLFPLPLLFFTGVYFYSFVSTFILKTVKWKGRSIYN